MSDAPLEMVIQGRKRDLGGLSVRRVLPYPRRRMVGPFIFFDEMGPEILGPGHGVDVRPHPHIGLSTVTYLFEGEILHRDSLGTVQPIRPGEVNWMTAGRGIAHSERTPPALRPREKRVFGIQVWVAHPLKHEACPPAFAHHGAEALPRWVEAGWSMRLIVGSAGGATSPVAALSPTLYAEVHLQAGAAFELPGGYEERAVYVAEGAVASGGATCEPGGMAVFGKGTAVVTAGPAGARLMIIGGDRLDGERYIDWNFVASSKERLRAARADWAAGRFAKVPGETEFIPLPEGPSTSNDVTYP